MSTSPSIMSVDDQALIRLVEAATQQLFFVAPGISEQVSKALVSAWTRLGDRMSVVLDADPACCRLGYGTEAGLKLLHEAAGRLGVVVSHQPDLRIGVIVTEHETLIFTPSPLLLTDGSKSGAGANAVSIPGSPPPMLAKELGIGPRGVSEQLIGLDALTTTRIQALSEDLKRNPPVPFDISRQVLVFNAKLEFVEFSVAKIQVERIDIPIPTSLIGFADASLRTLFRFDPGAELTIAKQAIELKKREIDKAFTRPAKGFGGSLIERTRKDEFLKAVDGFRKELNGFRELVETKFKAVATLNQNRLYELLLPAILKKPPGEWTDVSRTAEDRTKSIEAHLARELKELFRVTGEKLVSEMRTTVLFKGVTFECLNSPEFKEIAQKSFPHLNLFHEEYQALPESSSSP